MKILNALHDFLPKYVAGSEIYCYNLSRELLKRGHDVYVFAGDYNNGMKQYTISESELKGIKCIYITNEFVGQAKFSDLYINERIAEIFGEYLDEIKPDIVHFHHLTRLSTTCIEEVKKRDIPIVYKIADFWLQCQRGQRIKEDLTLCWNLNPKECGKCLKELILGLEYVGPRQKNIFSRKINSLKYIGKIYQKIMYRISHFGNEEKILEKRYKEREKHIRKMLSLVDLFTAPSKFLREEYIKWGIPKEKIIYSDNGFRKDRFKNIQKIASETLRLAYIGSMIPTKGVEIPIKALNELQDEKIELKIYGNPNIRRDYYKYLVRLANRKNIRFLGEVSNDNLPELYRNIDLLIVPSFWFENSPLTIHEAYMAKTPVVASNIGGMAEYVIENKTGFHFKVGDDRDLFRVIKKIIATPEILKGMDFDSIPIKSIKENAEEMEKIYYDLMIK